MTMLIPFWVWLLIGVVLGWWLCRKFGKTFGFLGKIRRPFGKKDQSGPAGPGSADDEPPKGLFDRVTGALARPIEKFMGDDKKNKGKKK